MPSLRRRSIAVILANQAASGAFLACPNMPDYRYSWFRDGSYIAHALDLAGEHLASHRFHDWAAGVILANAAVVAAAEACAAGGLPLADEAILHTRYTAEGTAGSDAWPNFQLDGLGTWLWAVCDHAGRHSEPLPAAWQAAITLAARYLAALWRRPNFDLWEENGDRRHTYTQAAVYGGLAKAGATLGRPDWTAVAGEVRDELLAAAEAQGHFVKFLRGDAALTPARAAAVDGSLIGVALPHGVVPVDHPLLAGTAEAIEHELRHPGGGVYRFGWDEYYGGGEWILLTAWLGWYYAAAGRPARAAELLAWIEAQADAAGDLPEQVPQHLLKPAMYAPWVAQRGWIAQPLLWSHAMYLILDLALAQAVQA